MNAFDLPPLSAYPPSGSAPRHSLRALRSGNGNGQGPSVAQGLAAIEQPWDQEPLVYPCDPTPLKEPVVVAVSQTAAELVGESAQTIQDCSGWAAWLSGNRSLETPACYATVYAGHQFGVFVPRLGDGRALNLGAINGWELQLKGAGPTPFARHADGRAVLRSSVREFLCSEAMHSLGVATTRALSLVVSKTPVVREQLEPAAVVCRMAPSFLRFGHFEYFAYRARRHAQTDAQAKSLARQQAAAMLRSLAEADVAFQPLRSSQGFDQATDYIAIVTQKTGRLMADWMSLGFMHGVMNTDNFSALGLTIDYGPFSFMEAFDPNFICNHSDHEGRYSYANQPSIGFWNLQRLLGALASLYNLDLQSSDARSLFEEAQASYESAFYARFEARMREKLGLEHCERPELLTGIDQCFRFLHDESVDFSHFFRSLGHCQPFNTALPLSDRWSALAGCLPQKEASRIFIADFAKRVEGGQDLYLAPASSQGKASKDWSTRRRQASPSFVLRNWVLEEVIRALEDEGNIAPLKKAMAMLEHPFEDKHEEDPWYQAAPDWAKGLALSCSS